MTKVTVGSSEYDGLIEEAGDYPVELKKVEFKTLTGPNVQGNGKVIEFLFTVDVDGKDEDVSGLTSQNFSSGTKIMKEFAPALLGHTPEVGEEFDLDDFIGWKGTGLIEFKKTGWPAVEGLLVSRKRRAAPAPVQEADEAEEAPAPRRRRAAPVEEVEEAPAARPRRVREAVEAVEAPPADDRGYDDLPF